MPPCPKCAKPMHVEFTRKGNRHFLCTNDGARLVEPKSHRTVKKGRPLKSNPRPKRIRNEPLVKESNGIHRIK
jgi:hypothetical protein